jgi:peptide-methionine (S)-S-oxide reductase
MFSLAKMITACVGISVILLACTAASNTPAQPSSEDNSMTETNVNFETATFGAGCFWCVEAVFQQLDGVKSVTSGYMGGQVDNPTYEQICTGLTGHAEVCQVVYDPAKVNFETLLQAFWTTHDPTTLNRQGNDVGTQYRSAIFFHNEKQRQLAVKYKEDLNKSGAYSSAIVTEISPASTFYKAEDYHQNYYNLNKTKGYCQYVIKPKLDKFEKVFKDKMVKQK